MIQKVCTVLGLQELKALPWSPLYVYMSRLKPRPTKRRFECLSVGLIMSEFERLLAGFIASE
jgi:hypothetical protein